MASLLDDQRYHAFLRETHPELSLEESDEGVPLFSGVLDTRAPLLPGLWRTWRDVAHALLPRQVSPRALFVGGPFEPYQKTDVIARVRDASRFVDEVFARARTARAGVVVVTNVARHHETTDALVRAGFMSLPSFPDCVLELPATACTLDDVIAPLSRGRRRQVRRHVARFAREGHALSHCRDAARIAPLLYESYTPLLERAPVRWFPHSPAYFAGVAALDPRVVLSVSTQGGAVSGFVLGFFDDERKTFHAGRVGVHPRHHRRDDVYFRLVYRAVEDALAHGAARVSLEPTAYRMKRRLGAHVVPLVNLILPVSLAWRLVARRALPLGARALRHLEEPSLLEEHF